MDQSDYSGSPKAKRGISAPAKRAKGPREFDPRDIATREGASNDAMQPKPDRELWRGLSTKLLLLTVLFVMIAEITVFVPSIANFRNVWLQSHLDTAEAASIVYLDATDAMLSRSAQRKLLQSTDSITVVLREGGVSRLMASSDDIGSEVLTHINLTLSNPLQSVKGSIETLLFGGDNLIRVYGKMKDRQGEIELVQHDRFLRGALLTYFRNVMLLSLAISLITAALVFLALYLIIVRPIKRISRNMTEFSRQPENSALVFEPSGRSDEIGVAEERLASFQRNCKLHCAKSNIWLIWVLPSPKSIMICETSWHRRNCFLTACLPCLIQQSSDLPPN